MISIILPRNSSVRLYLTYKKDYVKYYDITTLKIDHIYYPIEYDIINWLKINIKKEYKIFIKWTYNETINYSPSIYMEHMNMGIDFEDEKEALLFKLTWV